MTAELATPIQRARVALSSEADAKRQSEAERVRGLWTRFVELLQSPTPDIDALAAVLEALGIQDSADEYARIVNETLPELRKRIERGIAIEHGQKIQAARAELKVFLKETEEKAKELRMKIGNLEAHQSHGQEAARRLETLRRQHPQFMAAVESAPDAAVPKPIHPSKPRRLPVT